MHRNIPECSVEFFQLTTHVRISLVLVEMEMTMPMNEKLRAWSQGIHIFKKLIKQSLYTLEFENSYNGLNLLILYHHDLFATVSSYLSIVGNTEKCTVGLIHRNQRH